MDAVQNKVFQTSQETKSFFQKVYIWMFAGLTISGITAYIVSANPSLYEIILLNKFIFYGCLISEILLILGLFINLKKISARAAVFWFFLYCFTSGLTLSVIFLLFTIQSIGMVFFIAAFMFGVMSLFGYVTKMDLSRFTAVLNMGLLGLITASFVNLFNQNQMVDYVLSFAGVIIFTVFTAHDTQMIKKINKIGNAGTPEDTKESIIGALILYLDFMNLFMKLLNLLGKKK